MNHRRKFSSGCFSKSQANQFYLLSLLQSEVEEELEPHERKKLKKMKAVSDSEEEEDGKF